MRRLLYLSPYFPPQTRVGALRPLKFARHLPTFGWAPVVLADLWSGEPIDDALADAVPDSTIVIRDWSRRAAPEEQRWLQRRRASSGPAEVEVGGPRDPGRVRSERSEPKRRRLALPAWLDNPELIPLGEHGPRIPYALQAARRVLDRHPCDAILVNADPFAATLVGARLAEQTGLPLVVDLRDPWAHCELRRPMRPLLVRNAVDRLERSVIRRAAAVILNTEATLDDYRRAYPELPPDRFVCIRNHGDAALVADGSHAEFDRFTLLFLGNFGRFIKADVLVSVLAELAARGVGPDAVQLVVTGAFPEEGWRMVQGMGVANYLHLHPHVSYREIGAIMAAADVLVLLVQPHGRQRLAAKLFDYLVAERPVLAISESAELAGLLAQSGAGRTFPYADVAGIADEVMAQMAAGRGRVAPRAPIGATSREATQTLAALLDRVVAAKASGSALRGSAAR